MRSHPILSSSTISGRAEGDKLAPSPSRSQATRPGPLHSRIGSSVIYDPVAGTTMTLPSGMLVLQNNGRIWLGSSGNGRIFLYLERIPASAGNPPTILAEDDLDLYLCAVGAAETVGNQEPLLEMAGALGRQAVRGCLALGPPQGEYAYLVLTICPETDETADLASETQRLLAMVSG